jgi:hypothetical protein
MNTETYALVMIIFLCAGAMMHISGHTHRLRDPITGNYSYSLYFYIGTLIGMCGIMMMFASIWVF